MTSPSRLLKSAALAALALPLCASSQAMAQGSGSPLFNPGNGHHYEIVTMTLPWDQARDHAATLSYQGVPGHLVTMANQAEDFWVYFTLNSGSLGNSWIGLYQDTNDAGYSEPLGGWKWVTGEPMTYSNWTNGEPNDGGAAEHYGGYWPADKWNDYRLSDGAVTKFVVEYDTAAAIPFCGGQGSVQACPCGNFGTADTGCSNSTSFGASLLAAGHFRGLAMNNLGFTAIGLVPGQPAMLFQGDVGLNNGNGLIFGDGLRCAGLNVRRLGISVPDITGSTTWQPDVRMARELECGDVRRFQVWYSDSLASTCGSGFNTSNGLEVTFTP